MAASSSLRNASDARYRGAPPDVYARVPARALLLSALALSVPIASGWFGPTFDSGDLEILLFLPALVPAFLLTYHRGWRGASVALAAGMAVLALTQVVVAVRGGGAPDWRFLFGLIALLMGVSLGVGWVGELLHRARRDAEAMALTDPLTGLPNRRHLDVFLDAAFAAAERGGQLSVVLFDLDRFKAVNDAHGHAAGDRVLRAFGAILRQQTRRADLSARFGGEEFVTALTGAAAADALRFVERVRGALAAESFPWGPVTVSAGVAAHDPELGSPDALVAQADRALYRAKEAGRNRAVVWEPDLAPGKSLAAVDALEGDGASARTPGPLSTAAGAPDTRRAPRGRPRVLVVDDDLDTLWSLARLVSRLGFQVDTASDGHATLERVSARRPDVVLSDVVMPGMGGFTLADRLARERPGLPVLLVSGYDHDALAEARRPASVVGFLRKPIELRELGVALEQALAESRPPGT